LLAERWILARLRNQRFFGLDEVNAAIRPLLDQFNGKVTRHPGASRRDLFERLDRPALKPTFADAILDRLVHNAYRAELDGQSMRKTKYKTGDESAEN